MDEDANIEDLDPSPGPNEDVEGASEAEANLDTASSSDAAGDSDTDSVAELLSVVRDVVEPQSDEEGKGGVEKDGAVSPTEGEEDDGGDAAEDDYSDVPFHKHPRFQQLVEQKNTLAHQLKESERFREGAERFENIQRFMADAGLSGEETAFGLNVMALAKTDPATAWSEIKPWLAELLQAAGEVLPDDLRERVAKGDMTEDVAREISRARAAANSQAARSELQDTRREQDAQRDHAEGLRTTATDWAAERKKRDPNFDTKMPLLQREIAWLQTEEGKPTTKEGVLAQLQKAYANVNEQLGKRAKPTADPKPEIKPVVGGNVAGGQPEGEQSTLDIVRSNRRTG